MSKYQFDKFKSTQIFILPKNKVASKMNSLKNRGIECTKNGGESMYVVMYVVKYNANANRQKYINKRVNKISIKVVNNHKTTYEEALSVDEEVFSDLSDAVSFLRECSYPITTEKQLTGFEFEEERTEFLKNAEFSANKSSLHPRLLNN